MVNLATPANYSPSALGRGRGEREGSVQLHRLGFSQVDKCPHVQQPLQQFPFHPWRYGSNLSSKVFHDATTYRHATSFPSAATPRLALLTLLMTQKTIPLNF